MSSIPRVALLVETTRTYTRDLVSGIRRYLAEKGPWSVFIELRALDSSPPPWLGRWDGDGIICRTFTREMAEAVAACGLPAVETRSSRLCPRLPFVGMDNSLIGAAVARHFLQRGYRNFAAYRLDTEDFFEERVANFVAVVEREGARCAVLPGREPDSVEDWEASQRRLIEWVASLPKPVGVFAANDQLGFRLLDACQRAGIAVPEEVAVVGTEDEETLCGLAAPPLSSLRFDGQAVGYLAAETLAGMMRGEEPPARVRLVPPKGIVTRGSSDETVVNDPLVQRAARLVRERACEGLNVEQLCAELRVSRSALERRMKAAIGRTPKEELQRMRFRRAEWLLRETDLTMECVAEQCGFAHGHYFQSAFGKRYGRTPGQFRREG